MHRHQVGFATLVLLSAIPCLASPPSPANSTVPACIMLVTTTGPVLPNLGLGEFTVVVRDIANNPVAGARVSVDLSQCPDLHICADQQDAVMTVDCAGKRVSKLTGADGAVHMSVLGGSNGPGNAVELLGAGKIYWDGTLIGSPTVSAVDLDGQAGLGANDLSAFLTDFASGNPYGRCDYDCSGTIGANDFSLWLQVYALGTMTKSCSATCP